MVAEDGHDVATKVTQAGDRVSEAIQGLTQIVEGVQWVGPDADTYKEDWGAFVNGDVAKLVEAFTTFGQTLERHATEQDDTSQNG
ncbi:hypothetical protein JSY14_03280 [Brachybacterium sp. EF45031]|nr:hypothetical protein [Brachybacterium sillae]